MPNQVCCSLSGLLCPAPPKVDKPLQMFEADQRRHATNRRQVMHSSFEPGPMELCSSVGSERASSRATDFSITSIRLGHRPQRSSGEAPTQARAPLLCECLRELEIGLGESQGWKQPA